MRIDERMMTVLTGLFLAVTVGVIVQNRDSMMTAFKGESPVEAVDDIYTVRAGRTQTLYVLSNDDNAAKVSVDDIRLTRGPDCGEIVKSGSAFEYTGTQECAGIQSFTYCLSDAGSCEPAKVALRVMISDSQIVLGNGANASHGDRFAVASTEVLTDREPRVVREEISAAAVSDANRTQANERIRVKEIGTFSINPVATAAYSSILVVAMHEFGLDAMVPGTDLFALDREPTPAQIAAADDQDAGDDFSLQAALNLGDQDASNINLGGADAEPSVTQAGTLAQADVATDTSDILIPAADTVAASIDGLFEFEAPGDAGTLAESAAYDVATLGDSAQQSSMAAGLRDVVLPKPPVGAISENYLPVLDDRLSVRIAGMDSDFQSVNSEQHTGLSPFGTPCEIILTATPKPGGMVSLNLDAPCHPASRVVMRHHTLMFTGRTSHNGTYTVDVPAFERQAAFSALFDDGQTASAIAVVADVAVLERVGIQWTGSFDLDLHALEFGASQGSGGHVWSGQPRSIKQTRRYGGGFSVQLGDNTVHNPIQAEVYTLPLSGKTRNGTIRLVVEAYASTAFCGQEAILYSMRSNRGQRAASPGLQFKMPECDGNRQSLVLKNAVRDLNIALK